MGTFCCGVGMVLCFIPGAPAAAVYRMKRKGGGGLDELDRELMVYFWPITLPILATKKA